MLTLNHLFVCLAGEFIPLIYSDKIALWNVTGLQGALLSRFIAPIFLSSVVVSDELRQDSMHRALISRIQQIKNTDIYFSHCSVEFCCIKKLMEERYSEKEAISANTGKENYFKKSNLLVSR